MTTISLVKARFEDGAFSGVPRFDFELRRALPGLVSLKAGLAARVRLLWQARDPALVVITSGELLHLVPRGVKAIVVHHGCAAVHYERDPTWRGARERAMVEAQRRMYERPLTWFVSPARWTSGEFSRRYGVPPAALVPHWVDPIVREPKGPPTAKPIVLGDWRDFNKGRVTIERLRVELPGFEFRPLKCTYADRGNAYRAADAWLCLSLSEGGSYAMSDAEAAGLPIVSTDVGNYLEYEPHLLAWTQRDDPDLVGRLLDRALARARTRTFFDGYPFERWAARWRALVDSVRRGDAEALTRAEPGDSVAPS